MYKRTRSFWTDILTPETMEQINAENRMAIRLLARAGIPLSIANYFAQTVLSTKGLLSLRSYWLLIYFVGLFLLEKYVIPQRCRHATVLLYFIEAPILVITILLGSVWDPDHQALTFLMFLMAMPVFILDRPLRLLGVFTGWTAAFLVICKLVKDPSTNRGDFFHAAEFYLATAAVTYVVLRVRMGSLKHLERTQYHLEHDELTGCRNRRSLLGRTELYVHKPLLVLTADLDRLELYNDFYGRDVGDEIMLTFTDAVVKRFGREDCYRVAGSQVLCILQGVSLEECLQRIETCRQSLRHRSFEDWTITLNVAFGYVTGTPEDANVLSDMIQLSGIYAHKAKLIGQEETEGGPFSPQALNAAIEESNVDVAARVYEKNQLTGLPSMSFFISNADELFQSLLQRERHPVVGYFNLLRFRSFNDNYGYKEGDRLIRYLAGALQSAFPNRTICCISGSTFGLVIYRDEIDKGLQAVKESLSAFKPGVELKIKAGFALFTEENSAISLLDRAKIAHNSIRDSEGETYRIYDEALDRELRFRQYLIAHLDQAVEENWLKVYYQPIVRSVNGKICNEEALSRWVDPVYGFLPPYRFIPVLEENRLIYKVSLHVVRTVLSDFRQKEAAGIPLVPVSVNLSRYDFEQCDMVEEITRLVAESGYSPGLLKIEITESAFTEHPEMLKREVDRFHSNGFEVWMDDFGSEYSTLNLLQDLNFDLIKIDMQFMKNYTACGRNSIIVSDIVDMAHQLGITTLIEGIETDEHFRLLRDLGCEKLQGFLFDRPSPLEHVLESSKSDGADWFETWDENDYYSQVGGIDLIHPLSAISRKGITPFSAETPAGVLELWEDGFTCLRGSGAFLSRLVELGLLSEEEAEQRMPRLKPGPPRELVQTVQRCAREKDWISLHLSCGDRPPQTCYLIHIADHKERDAIAVLAVFLPSHQRNY